MSAPKYPTDGSNPSYASMSNVTSLYVDKDRVQQAPATGSIYPSSSSFGSETIVNETSTQADFVLSVNNMLTEIWGLSQLMPGIYQVMSSGATPSTASSQPAFMSTDVSQYIVQMSSLKFNTFKRRFDKTLRDMERWRIQLNSLNYSGVKAPTSATNAPHYPSSGHGGY